GLPAIFCWIWFFIATARRANMAGPALVAGFVFALTNFPLYSAPHALALGLLTLPMTEAVSPPSKQAIPIRVGLCIASIILAAMLHTYTLWPSLHLRNAMNRQTAGVATTTDYM